jgi:hypothetical protein
MQKKKSELFKISLSRFQSASLPAPDGVTTSAAVLCTARADVGNKPRGVVALGDDLLKNVVVT